MNSYEPPATVPRVTFLGAARSVTGSMHLLDCGPYRLLLDCGLHRGPREEAAPRNRHFPFDPASIDAVVLSHAHVDHCGNLPNLLSQGFAGPIYCTPATRELIDIMLSDSARIQEDDVRVHSVVGGRHGRHERRPLYTREDASATVGRCVTVPYNRPALINADVEVTFADAGHILGSAVVSLRLQASGRERRVTFTGDLGRRGLPFLRDPAEVPAADLLISESTYGGKTHDTLTSMAQKMGDVVRRTLSRGGKVFIPAFSLGRTQVVVHYLRRWMADGTLPRLPVYVDSPLAADIGQVYDQFADDLPAAERSEIPVEFVDGAEEAHAVSEGPEPCIVVASGGMCEGGRIVPHLRRHIDDPRSCIVLVSYQAPQSLGAQLLQRRPTVRFHGRTWNKWVEVVELNGFSGHADHDDFRVLLGRAAGRTGRVRLVHGEPERSAGLAAMLRDIGFADVAVPAREETVCVG